MDDIQKNFINASESAWEDLGNGVQRQILGYNSDLMLVKVKLDKGTIMAKHQHPHVQSSYLEAGVIELDLDGEKRILQQGDAFFVPSNVWHGVRIIETAIIIDAFSPYREEFIKE